MARKEDIARDTWQAFTEVMRSGRATFPAVARQYDLTPGELRALLALDPDHPHPMRMLDSLACVSSARPASTEIASGFSV